MSHPSEHTRQQPRARDEYPTSLAMKSGYLLVSNTGACPIRLLPAGEVAWMMRIERS